MAAEAENLVGTSPPRIGQRVPLRNDPGMAEETPPFVMRFRSSPLFPVETVVGGGKPTRGP